MAGVSISYSHGISWSRCRLTIPVLVASALLFSSALAGAETGTPGQLIETKPAKPVPVLTLTDLAQEQPTDLSAYKGKPLDRKSVV